MTSLTTYQFHDPNLLWLLLVIPFILIGYFWQSAKRTSTLKIPSLEFTLGTSNNKISWFKHVIFGLKLFTLTFLILGLARPQLSVESQSVKKLHKEGIDIIISMEEKSQEHIFQEAELT